MTVKQAIEVFSGMLENAERMEAYLSEDDNAPDMLREVVEEETAYRMAIRALKREDEQTNGSSKKH